MQNFKLLTYFCSCTDQFVSDQVGNPEDPFSHVAARMVSIHYVGVKVHVLTAVLATLSKEVDTHFDGISHQGS